MLQTQFERVLGDIGNPESFDFPVLYHHVPGATVDLVVNRQGHQLVHLFAEHAQLLVAQGATAITTSCGFLARFQGELARLIDVPFEASSLSFLDHLAGTHERVGIVTANSRRLGPAHYAGRALAPAGIVGLEETRHFRAAVLDEREALDKEGIQAEVLCAVEALLLTDPAIDGLILECTNLPPYRKAIEERFGLPIYDAIDLARLMAGSG